MTRFIDLSQTIPDKFDRAGYFKGMRSSILPWHNIKETKIQETKLLLFNDHVGTHIEAPSHFNPKGKTIDQMNPKLVFEKDAVLMDLSHKQKREEITVQDLKRSLKQSGETLRREDIPLIYTGASKLWKTPAYWRYTIPIAKEAVLWLLGQGVKIFGVDEDEIDRDQLTWPAHSLMKLHEFYIIENLALWPAVLDLPRRFKFYGVPLAIDKATASPIRAVARLN